MMGKVRGEGEKTKKPSRGKREREGKYLLLERGLKYIYIFLEEKKDKEKEKRSVG
jgi:hypothetical protein